MQCMPDGEEQVFSLSFSRGKLKPKSLLHIAKAWDPVHSPCLLPPFWMLFHFGILSAKQKQAQRLLLGVCLTLHAEVLSLIDLLWGPSPPLKLGKAGWCGLCYLKWMPRGALVWSWRITIQACIELGWELTFCHQVYSPFKSQCCLSPWHSSANTVLLGRVGDAVVACGSA